MYVGISIRDEATRTLSRIDTTMNSLESHFRRFGSSINSSFHGMNGLNSRIDASANNMRILQRYTNRLEQEMSEARSEMQRMTQRISAAEAETESLRNEMQRVNNQVNNANKSMSIFGSTAGKVKNTIIGIGTAIGAVKVVEKGISMVKGSIDGAIGRVDTLNGFPTVMEKMGFASEKSSASIDKLSNGIQGLPTTLDGIVGSTKNIALMTGDLDMATDTALSLNNAFIASGSTSADAERGLDQYVKMLSKGKVEADSWSTLQETMGFALNKTAEAFGYTGKSAQRDLYTALQKGKIKFEDFNKKIISLNGGVGGFAEIAKESSSGIATSWSNMKTAVTRGTAGIIQSIQDTLAGTPLKSIENVLGLVGKGFSNALGLVAEKIKGIDGKKLGDKLNQGFKTVKSIAIPAIDAIKTGLGWLIEHKEAVIAVGGGIAAGFAAFKGINAAIDAFKTIKSFAGAFTMLSNPVGIAALAIGGLVMAGIYLYRNWDTIKVKALELWQTLRENPMMAMVAGPIGALISAGVYLYNNWDTIKERAIGLWATITEKFAEIKQSVSDFVQPAIGWFETIGQKWNDFKSSLSNFKVPQWVSTVGSKIGSLAGGGMFKKMFNGSHATGLERVPYDGYVAELHKGESVLTTQQSNALRSAGILSQNSDGTPSLNMGGGSTTQQAPNAGSGGHQFIFQITGDSPLDIAQKVREVVSDLLGEELQIM